MTDKLQALMNQAYGRWQASTSMTQQEFWDGLSARERCAVFFGNMNYQVQNGGWMQWVDNSYASVEVVGYLRRTMRRMLEGTEAVGQVLTLMESFLEDNCEVEDGQYVLTYSDGDFYGEGNPEDGPDHSSQYYKVDDLFMKEVEAKLEVLFPEV